MEAPRVSIRDAVAWQAIGGEIVLLDLDAGTAMGLNDTGTFVFPRLETTPLAVLAADVAAHFDVDVATAQRDVDAFVDDLVARGIAVRTTP